MNKTLVSLVGGVAGSFLGYIALNRLLRVREAVIAVTADNGRCTSRTRPARLKAKRLNAIHWRIDDPDECLNDAGVELRFSREDSPVTKRRPRGRRSISDRVVLVRPRVYEYKVWYVAANGTEYEMEDPELQIEF